MLLIRLLETLLERSAAWVTEPFGTTPADHEGLLGDLPSGAAAGSHRQFRAQEGSP
ncbi:MAG: hypothetical protein ACYDC5_03870 [Candidatus Dormibacteria bacterium]